MSEKIAQALLEPIKQIALAVVQDELRQFRTQLQDICLRAVEAAFENQFCSDKFRDILCREVKANPDIPSQENVKKMIHDAVNANMKTIVARPASGGGGKDIPNVERLVEDHIHKFLTSNEMKEMLDQKFRAIDLYLKTDLIPKVVKREISKSRESV